MMTSLSSFLKKKNPVFIHPEKERCHGIVTEENPLSLNLTRFLATII